MEIVHGPNHTYNVRSSVNGGEAKKDFREMFLNFSCILNDNFYLRGYENWKGCPVSNLAYPDCSYGDSKKFPVPIKRESGQNTLFLIPMVKSTAGHISVILGCKLMYWLILTVSRLKEYLNVWQSIIPPYCSSCSKMLVLSGNWSVF